MSKSKIIVSGTEEEEVKTDAPAKLNYKATEIDEECFFLMYNMKMQPSEAYGLHPERRRWIIARLIHQSQMENEMHEQAALKQHLMAQGSKIQTR